MVERHVSEELTDEQVDLPPQDLSVDSTGGPRLSNREKLYHVPVFALRELLERRNPGRKLGHLRQADLVAEADRLPAITSADVEDLYETYRYGGRLSFYLYLLPENLPEPVMEEVQSALDNLALLDHLDLADQVVATEDYEGEASPSQILLLDEERLDGIREIRFRYYVPHRFLNSDEEPDQVLQTRYGFLWLDLMLGYLAILSRDERVLGLLTRALSNCLQAIPLPVRFPKELLDKHFSIEKVKSVSHYDPGTGVRQSISGRDLWKAYEQQILDRDQRYARPSSLYEEQVADGVISGLGVTSSKGKIYLTKTLPTSLVRAWGLQLLPDLVRDVKDLRQRQPDSFDRSLEAINRIRLPSKGRAAVVTIAEALLQTDRENLTSVTLPLTALAIYDALAGKYFDPYLRTLCVECEGLADLCPYCEGHTLELEEQGVTCKECGAIISDEESVLLRCMNGHLASAPRDEVWSIAPNHWLQKRMTRIFAEIGQAWSERTDYFHIEGNTLYRLRRGQVESKQLPQVVQTYVNNFWEPVEGPVHAGTGNIVASAEPEGDLGQMGRPPQPEMDERGALPRAYKNFDLRLRGSSAAAFTVEAAGPDGGSVPPQPLTLPPDEPFRRQLGRVLLQTTSGDEMRGVGQTLFKALFPPHILKLWSRSVGGLGEEMGLRLRLHIGPGELMTLPWELAFEEEYVGLRRRFPIVRFLDLADPPKPLAIQPPLRVLVAVSQPKDVRPFDVDAELANIRSALGQLSDGIEMDVLRNARRDELLARLRQGYHVLHYVGHGVFEGGTGHVILEDPDGRSDPVSALLLGHMVADSDLRLAVLNACETSSIGPEGAFGPDSAFGGVAHHLVKGGIPAVVAMQLAVTDQTASAFSRGFYGALADGWPVDAAVQEGRRGIMTMLGSEWAGFVDWAIPTLYMRAPDGVILRIRRGEPRGTAKSGGGAAPRVALETSFHGPVHGPVHTGDGDVYAGGAEHNGDES
ncbi:CHAT domain-containing protein [Chloroflexota bacterium]